MGLLTALGLGLLMGLINGCLVLTLRISPLIVTLALMGIYAGVALLLTKSFPVSGLPFGLSQFVQTTVAGVPMSVIIALVVFALGVDRPDPHGGRGPHLRHWWRRCRGGAARREDESPRAHAVRLHGRIDGHRRHHHRGPASAARARCSAPGSSSSSSRR